MARRGEDTTPKLQNFQAGPSWMPATPAKPDSTRQQPICANWQENQHVQTNWLEPKILSRVNQVTQGNWSDTGRLPGNFVVETPSQTLPCYSSINSVYESGDFATWGVGEAANSRVYRDALRGFDTWQAGNVSNSHVQGEDLRRNDKISVDDAEKWTMSFGNLLALAHGVGNTSAAVGNTSAAVGNTSAENAAMQAGFVAKSSTFAPSFLPYTEDQSMISFGNSSAPELDNLLVRNFEDGLKRMPNILRDRSSIPSRPFFDLNSPPRTIRDAALSIGTPSHFQPITPEKTSKAEQLRESAIIDLTADDVPLAKDVQKNIIAGDKLKGHYEKKEQSQPVTYQSYETTLTELSENHKPDKGGTAEADSSKTPQQKPRRRKHRPKVIIEGQTKRTPKPHSEIPSASQETPSVKRKYVRRKAVDNTNTSAFEGETNENDSSKKTPPKDTPVGKRKYVRKKRKEESEANTDERNSEMTEPKTVQNTRNSCRRSLNFTLDSQVRDEGSSYSPSSNCNMELQAENFGIKVPSKTPSMHCGQGTGEKNDMGIAYELTKTAYQDVQDYLSRPGIQTLSCSPPIKPDSLQYGYRISDTKGKCQLVFSDVTHDKEVNTAHVTEHTDSRQWTPKSPNNSIGSSTCFIQGKQPRGFKRQHMGNTVEEELCSTNGSGAFNNSMQMYLSLFSKNADKNNCTSGMHFPTIYKKKRTEKGLNAATSSSQYTACASNTKLAGPAQRDSYLSASTSRGFLVAPYEATNLLMTNPAPHGTQTGRQDFEDLLTLGPTEKIKRKRSKVPTRVRDLASLLEICKELPVSPGKAAKTSKSKRGIEIHREPYTCMEALVADTCSTMTTKKRSKRSLVNSTSQSFSNHHEFANKSTGPPLAITWTYMSPIDSMIDQLNQLDLNGESSHSAQKQNEFTAYEMHYQEQHALVPYQSGGAVVPFDGSFNQVKKRRPRPKVNLDDETTRVWKLLLENINSEGIDGTDEDKTKWWEEERRVFNGRADSFIARMHLVQGDRRFSPWKGSVLDSVVGVFLTQNVSDHLSSSAFMSLAARFPIVSENNAAEFHEARENTQTREPEICVLDSDETFGSNNDDLLESACREDAEMLQDFEDSDSRVADSIKFSSDDTIPKDNCGGQSPDVAKLDPVVSTESVPNKSVSVIGEGREMDDTVSSQASVISSQNSEDSPITQTTERTDSCSLSNSEEEPAAGVKPNRLVSSTSFVKLLQMAGSVILHGVYEEGSDKKVSDDNQQLQLETLALNSQNENPWGYPAFSTKPSSSCNESALGAVTNLEVHAECLDLSKKHGNYSDTSSRKETRGTETSGLSAEFAPKTTSDMSMAVHSKGSKLPCPDVQQSNNDKIEIGLNKVEKQTGQVSTQSLFPENSDKVQDIPDIATFRQNLMDVTASSSITDNSRNSEHKEVNSSKNDPNYLPVKTVKEPKAKGKRTGKEKQNTVDWDNLRKQAQEGGRKRERTANTMDSVDWDAVRCADVNEIAETIKERGMNNMLAERIKDFLNRLVRDHETLDLEWLRDVPPDKAKEYLLSIRGLGLKSVECVRLLTLHHLAFPVDTNVGRIAVRLGWVPLQPLPESLQLHLLELYPILESIQKYLWPRLCKLDQRTLYELHYQMITFGKVFCTKSKPNCNACPMRGECRHFASAFASARLALPAPEEKSIVNASENREAGQNPVRCMNTLQLPSPQADLMGTQLGVSNSQPIIEEPASPEPIVEVPDTPEPEYTQVPECDIEDTFGEDPDETPTIQLNIEQFTQNLQRVMQQNTELQEGDMSRALVALTPDAASIPMPKLKNMSRLRTEHQVYELPDSHPLLEGMDKREPDDPSPYLLAIWTPGETVDSIEPPQTRCSSSQGSEKLCTDQTCLSCSSLRELKSQTVRGTLLIPCRTAMRGSFPLNGTYFQVNEVFSDHESSLTPMDVPREWLWNLPRRTVYFGTSIPTIFKGLTTEGIQYCFWRGFVCVRGFDRRNRAPRPLIARLHFPASKLAAKGKGKADDN